MRHVLRHVELPARVMSVVGEEEGLFLSNISVESTLSASNRSRHLIYEIL